MKSLGILVVMGFLALVREAEAQNYSINWSTVDSGGGTSSGGQYTVRGTIGQPDAGVLSGGSYVLEGGLWPGLIVESAGDGPTLYIRAAGTSIQIGWAPATSGFTLEMAESLEAAAWVTAPGGNPVTISVTGGTRFFRLRKP